MAQGPLVSDWPLIPGTRFDLHVHDVHQLSIATSHAFAMGVDDRTWVVPPARALWIPAGTWHSVEAIGTAEMRVLWVEPAHCPVTWDRPTVVDVDPLVDLLTARTGDEALTDEMRARTLAVLFDVLHPVDVEVLDLVLPTDDRARQVADAVLRAPSDNRTLAEWGHRVGAGDRTLMRAFRRETGIGFAEWRTRARMSAALRLLLTDRSITTIATDVGYTTTSAFDAAFRRTMGVPPSTYRARTRTGTRNTPAGKGKPEVAETSS